jgi:hypothetical protein
MEGALDALSSLWRACGNRAADNDATSPPRRRRRSHLEALGIPYPAADHGNGQRAGIIKRLRGPSNRPVVFVDDQPRNLASAQEFVPDVHLIHLMSDNSLRKLLPEPPEGAYVVEDWKEATPIIAAALGI